MSSISAYVLKIIMKKIGYTVSNFICYQLCETILLSIFYKWGNWSSRKSEMACSTPHSQSMAKLGPEPSLPLLSLVLLYKSRILFKNEQLLFYSLLLHIKCFQCQVIMLYKFHNFPRAIWRKSVTDSNFSSSTYYCVIMGKSLRLCASVSSLVTEGLKWHWFH